MKVDILVYAVAAVLLHEFAHILTALSLRVGVRRIGLSRKGPLVRESDTTAQNVAASLSHPMAELLTALVCALVGHGAMPFYVRAVVGLYKLLPVPSSDGLRVGRMMPEDFGFAFG